jgi:hypothetical protein
MTDQKKNSGWFKKGTSGNPKGRPKGAKNQAALLEAIVNAVIPVTENGRKKMISKREAALIQLANKAAGGDLRAIKMLEGLYERHCKSHVIPPKAPPEPSLQDKPLTQEEAARLYQEALKNAKPAE